MRFTAFLLCVSLAACETSTNLGQSPVTEETQVDQGTRSSDLESVAATSGLTDRYSGIIITDWYTNEPVSAVLIITDWDPDEVSSSIGTEDLSQDIRENLNELGNGVGIEILPQYIQQIPDDPNDSIAAGSLSQDIQQNDEWNTSRVERPNPFPTPNTCPSVAEASRLNREHREAGVTSEANDIKYSDAQGIVWRLGPVSRDGSVVSRETDPVALEFVLVEIITPETAEFFRATRNDMGGIKRNHYVGAVGVYCSYKMPWVGAIDGYAERDLNLYHYFEGVKKEQPGNRSPKYVFSQPAANLWTLKEPGTGWRFYSASQGRIWEKNRITRSITPKHAETFSNSAFICNPDESACEF